MVAHTPTAQPTPGDEIISQRLIELLDDMLDGRAPNAGRFCGNCYHPLAKERTACPHCGTVVAEVPTTEAVPLEIIDAHRKRRGREGTTVRTIAWTGLTLGVVAALVPLAFGGVQWWTIILFFGLMFVFYLGSANLANTVGDSLGYRWGQSLFRKRWEQHIAARGSRSQR
jgi:hypothetical protein